VSLARSDGRSTAPLLLATARQIRGLINRSRKVHDK
jgi:hypothetical protein